MADDAEKPSLFIASSIEGLELARAARSLLAGDARSTLWNERFFSHESTYLDTLVNARGRFDFWMVIRRADDLVISRADQLPSPSDSVVFELGLFMGDLGRERTFMVRQCDVKLPSDLAGLATGSCEWPSHRNGPTVTFKEACEALGAVCDPVREIIRDRGATPARTIRQLGRVQQRQDVLESRVRALQIVVKGIVTACEWGRLAGRSRDQPFPVPYHDDMDEELKRLDAFRSIQPRPDHGITGLMSHAGTGREFDLKHSVQITQDGLEYLALRKHLMGVL